MTVRLVEVSPGVWRVDRPRYGVPRSDLPLPNVISDIMEPTEQVDGRFYTSKRAFRAVGRAHGLTEVGNEKFGKKWRSTDLPQTKQQRRYDIHKAVEQFKSGHRPRSNSP
jgi:hypothetical protein